MIELPSGAAGARQHNDRHRFQTRQKLRSTCRQWRVCYCFFRWGPSGDVGSARSSMAVIDRKLGPRIASVSGGTITNAFVAQRCNLEKVTPAQLTPFAALCSLSHRKLQKHLYYDHSLDRFCLAHRVMARYCNRSLDMRLAP